MNNRVISILKNGGLFVGLLILTFYIVLKEISLDEIITAVSGANKTFLFLGVVAMGIFLCCEAANIARCLRLFHYKVNPICGLKYALIGFFFSAVTPSASGGQPMQVYYMHKDRIDVSHSTLALLFELLSFETVTVTLAIAGFIYQYEIIDQSMGNMKYLLFVGVGLNVIVMILLIITIFTKKSIVTLANLAVKIVKGFSKTKGEKVELFLSSQIEEYQRSARYIKENKGFFLKTLATTLIQIVAMHSIPFLIYQSFGLNDYSLLEVIALQAVLYVAVSALPLPGAVGVSESGFMMLFRTLFPSTLLGSAMVLTRCINFYLFVLISGIIIALISLKKRNLSSMVKSV